MKTQLFIALIVLIGLATLPLARAQKLHTSVTPAIGITTRVSVASDGTQGNDLSEWPSISADGRYVAFSSWASNLVTGDTNGWKDIFVYDQQTNQTTRVSVASNGTQGDNRTEYPAISADGRYVTFESDAGNLVSGDTNGERDIFVHDQQTGQTTRVSMASDGTQGNDQSWECDISAEGRYVAFRSWASNLVPSDTNGAQDVFLHDRQTGLTTRVSMASDGTQGNSESYLPVLSADGHYVAFTSIANNLVPGDTNGWADVFVHDRETDQTSRVSIASDGTQGNNRSVWPTLSADGRYIAFISIANNLVFSDTNNTDDIFVHDRQTGLTTRISVATDGTQANSDSYWPDFSADGRYVAFFSWAANLVPGDTNSWGDVFVHDQQNGQTSRVSVASDGIQGNNSSSNPAISVDGRYVAFDSDASNLVPDDTNGDYDVFVHDRWAGSVTYSISGQVTDGNSNPIQGVNLSTLSGSTTTDASGYYEFTNLITGTYSVVPSHPSYYFVPVFSVVDVPPDAEGVDFVGTLTSTPVVLIPGIMGSRLSNDAGNIPPCSLRPEGEVWPNLLNLPNVPVYDDHLKTLWLQDDGINPANDCDNIQPTGTIDSLVGSDFYQTFKTVLSNEGYSVYSFDYDWRLSIEQISQKLDEEINALGVPKVILIGHSMGGLVARQYTLDPSRAEKVEKVISVGSPYWGAPALAKHMRAGTTPIDKLNLLTFNTTIWQMIRNSPGAMYLMPGDAFFQQWGSYYMDDQNFLDTYQETYNFFVGKNQNGTLINNGYQFHQSIDDFRNNLNVPYYVLTANHLPTVATVREYPCWYGGTCWKENSLIPGDGTVPWVSARLYGSAGDWSGNAEVCTFSNESITKDHAQLLSENNVIADIKNILNSENPTHCVLSSNLQQNSMINGTPGLFTEIALWGDARIEIQDSVGNLTGITEDGYLVNNIPESTLHMAGFGTFIILPTNSVYSVTLYQNNETPIQLQVTDLQSVSYEDVFNPTQRAVFVDVPSSVGGIADMVLDFSVGYENLLLSVDLNNDGTPDQTLGPTSILDPQQIADISRPVTVITVQGEQDGNFFTGQITITLTASDTGTSVLKTEYSLDGGNTWQIYIGPIQTITENVPVFYARSTDVAGNQEYPWPYQRLIPIQVFMPIVRH